MSKNLLLPLIVVILLGVAFFVFEHQTDTNLPFTPCKENCAPSKAFDDAALLTTARGVDFFAMKLRSDVAIPTSLKINVFADYNFSGRYDGEDGKEWVIRNAEVNAAPGNIVVFPMPGSSVTGTLPLTVLTSTAELGVTGAKENPPIFSASDFVFDTEEVHPVSGVFSVFDTIDREMTATAPRMGQVTAPSTCIGPHGGQVPCSDEGEMPSELSPEMEAFYFFQPENDELLNKILGIEETPSAPEFSPEFNFFGSEYDVQKVLQELWQAEQEAGTMNEYYWKYFSGTEGIPIEADEAAPSALDYLKEALVIS